MPFKTKEEKRLYDIEYRKKNADKIKARGQEYRKKNADIIKQKQKDYTDKIKDRKRDYDKKYREINKEKRRETCKKYYQSNRETLIKKQRTYAKENKDIINNRIRKKKETDELFRLKCSIRRLISGSFKRKSLTKLTKTEIILGCTFEQFKQHLESQFEPWMNWDNYGNPKDGVYELNKTWDIDHIIPLDNASTYDEVIKLNHHNNLKPLCSFYNRIIKKGNII